MSTHQAIVHFVHIVHYIHKLNIPRNTNYPY